MLPPKQIQISSNDKGIIGLPFNQDFLYITLDCKDLDLLDDTLVDIRAYG